MVLGGGRSSAVVSHADKEAAIFGHEHHSASPLKALKRMGEKLKPHTAVTTTEEEPGVSESDRYAGTSVPLAERSRKEALNAGFQPPPPPREEQRSRRSFSSFRSFRSRSSRKDASHTPAGSHPTSPRQDGTTSGARNDLPPQQREALRVSDNPHNHLDNAGAEEAAGSRKQQDNGHGHGHGHGHGRGHGGKDGVKRKPHLANTETFFEESPQQREREQMIREHIKNEHIPKNAHNFFDDPQQSEAAKNEHGVNENATASHPAEEGDAPSSAPNGLANGGASNGDAYGTSPTQPRESNQSLAEFADAPDPQQLNRTVSQPSPQAAGALSPRNRFVARSERGSEIPAAGAGLSNGPSAGPEAGSREAGVSPEAGGDLYGNANAAGTVSSFGGSQYHDAPPLGAAFGAAPAAGAANGATTAGAGAAAEPLQRRPSAPSRPASRTTSRAAPRAGSRAAAPSTASRTVSRTVSRTSSRRGSMATAPSTRVGADSDSDYGSDDDSEYTDPDEADEEESLAIPEGSVPGLGIGDEDPRLPGERRGAKKKPQKESEDLETEKAKARFLDHKEEIRLKRERQAEYSGWRQIGGWDKKTKEHSREDAETLLERSTLLETYVSERILGDWYQNGAIIVFTAFFAWVLGRLHLSMSWISLVLAFSATAYRTSVRRMRRNYRDDLLRESLLERNLDKDSESMEWLNGFMIKFWLIYEPSLSQMITQIGNEVLSEQTPGFIHSMKLDKFTLGTKAPRIDFVRSFPRTEPQIVVIDMGASFTPNDTLDLTARQLQTKVNPKVQLGVRIGKGFLNKHFPVLLEDMSFKGKFRLRFRLMERPPHIQTVDFSFLAPPDFDFKLKPIGGDRLGFDINIIPGLSKFIKDIVNANLGPMLYAPNAFQVNVEQLMAGVGPMSGVGVLSIQVISASNLKEDADGRVDPYVVLRDKNKKELAHTKIKSNTTSPVWNEILNVIIQNTNDNVLLEVFDFDESAPDRSVGQLLVKFDDLNGSDVVESSITSGGQKTGRLKYIAHYSPVTMPREDDTDSNTKSPRDTKSGILSLKVVAARDLDPTVSKTAKLNPFGEIELSGRLIDSTKVAKDTNDPEWNYAAEHIVMDKVSTLFFLRVRDNRSKIASPPVVGLFKMKLSKLLVQAEKGMKWFPLEDNKGEVKLEMQWKPANITVGGTTNNYVEPIGVIRLTIKNGKNLRNLEHIGKIDPYARVFIGRRLIARTDWFKNDLNPVWEQTLYLPVQSELQTMTIEAMDVENRGKDRSLGAFKIKLQNVIKTDENSNYKLFISDKTFVNKLMLPNRGPKGTIEYTMEFYPAIPVVSPAERERMSNDKKLIELLKKKVEDNGGDAKKALTEDERRQLAAREERLDYSGVNMPVEDQVKYDGGVFAIAIVSLHGHRVGQSLKIIGNNEPYPMYTTPMFKTSKRFSSDECPDFVSGQMSLSSLRFELGTFHSKSGLTGLEDVSDTADDDDSTARDPNAAEITIPCFELIKEASQNSKMYEMQNGAKLELQARYFPLPGLVIDPSEDIKDSGCIEIFLERADGVAAADSTGLSDPYTAFYLNNESNKIYKSKIKKATLDPVWNEQFRFALDNVKTSFIKAIVNDWDMGNRDDFLGGYRFDFSELEPLVWKEYAVPLEKVKKTREVRHKKDLPGTLYIKIRFLPGYLQKFGDKYLVGGASVTRAAGGLVGVASAAGAATGIVGAAAAGPQTLFNKLTGHGNDETDQLESQMVTYIANVESITGLAEVKHEIQIRCFMLTESGEKEVFRSSNVKLENGEATLTNEFTFRALPGTELGVKVLALKSLGRHSDVAQSSTDLDVGLKEIRLTKDAVIRISIDEERE